MLIGGRIMVVSLVVAAGASMVDMKRGDVLATFWNEDNWFVCWGAGLIKEKMITIFGKKW